VLLENTFIFLGLGHVPAISKVLYRVKLEHAPGSLLSLPLPVAPVLMGKKLRSTRETRAAVRSCAVVWNKILWHLLLNPQVSTESQVKCLKSKSSNFNPCIGVLHWIGICLRTSFSHIKLEQ